MEKGLGELTDLEIVERVKTGDRKSFSQLVRRHQKGLLRLSLRFVKDMGLAEDIVQETFIKAFEKLHTFEGRATFKSWLYQIGVNTSRNKFRETKFETTDIDNVHLAIGATAESSLVHSAVAEVLQSEVDRLPFKQKTALMLRIYEDLSFKEISDIMDCPYDTAKANYRHALLRLRQVFEERKDLAYWSEQVGGLFTEMSQGAEVME